MLGCASSSSMPEDNYYRLTPINQIEKLSAPRINATLVVERVKAYGIYHERAILYVPEDSPETLKYHHYHHWIDKPATLVREHLLRYLRDLAVADNIVADQGRQNDALLLKLDLKNFERELHRNGEVYVKISLGLRIVNKKHHNPILVQDYTETSRAEDGSMAATIHAFNLGLANIYQQLSEDLLASVDSL